ncbi:GLPGLI family protein [Tenacibaculum sp. AHE15PA]|uniref:GLPGLI family protein n=1 Tax=unclassified Tenacibaculum TaxID=2635139 RepID=UPI001C4FE445|nr:MULTISPECIES: GLPGLI family protein [unclassified Tenacibaculum]QXP72992.1 GLPGLI family protein [Tenacibaculum sp. AHE14PA]QXP76906.1 GLPGLI family protein [Tenacibaculum sp. AHE15PA]
MKKFIVTIFYLIISVNLFSQELFKSGEVVYSVKISPEQNLNNSLNVKSMYYSFQKKANRFSEKLKYTLKFNKKSSLFYMNSDLGMESEDNFNKLALVLNKGDNRYFVDTRKRQMIEEKPFFGEDFLVVSATSDLNWKLVNEKKKIGKYICYKATVQRKNKGPKNQVDPFSTYTAWYSPDISFNYGPFEFNSLPGLILELSIKERTYTASVITMKKETIKIDKLNKGKLVTKKEFDDMGEKAFKNR